MPKLNQGEIEVELKAWVNDFKALQKRVEKLAHFQEQISQEDIYFTFANTQGYQEQRFRLRQIGKKAIVTVKVPVRKKRTKAACEKSQFYEANQEFEFMVSDPEAFKVFCREFGFRVLVEKKKKVRRYLYRPLKKEFSFPVIIELNQVFRLGNFIELETIVSQKKEVPSASQFLKSLLQRLGISLSKIETRPYTELLYYKMQKS